MIKSLATLIAAAIFLWLKPVPWKWICSLLVLWIVCFSCVKAVQLYYELGKALSRVSQHSISVGKQNLELSIRAKFLESTLRQISVSKDLQHCKNLATRAINRES